MRIVDSIGKLIREVLPGIEHKITFLLIVTSIVIQFCTIFDKYWFKGQLVDFTTSNDARPFLNYSKYHVGLWEICRTKRGDILDDVMDICTDINVKDNQGHLLLADFSQMYNGSMVLPFPGASLQVARIWLCLALSLVGFGCVFVWLNFLSAAPRWLYAAYCWAVAGVLQLMTAILFTSCWGTILKAGEPSWFTRNNLYGSGMRLYITSLTITFVASFFALVIIRFRLPRPYSARRDVMRKIQILKHAKVSLILKGKSYKQSIRKKRTEG